jgi:nicotinamidase-related amidase
MPHATQMSAADTGLLVIDLQEKLLPLIPDAASVVLNTGFLIDAAQTLGMTVQATEQYPRGLGPTAAELARRLPHRPEKTAFSCCAIPEVVATFRREARPKIVLCGIESHVCVLNTALVTARFRVDHDIAMRRLEQAGAILTTAEGCVFEWVGGSGHPRFKEISRLVQERMKALQIS